MLGEVILKDLLYDARVHLSPNVTATARKSNSLRSSK
jgi:hypothetical protein